LLFIQKASRDRQTETGPQNSGNHPSVRRATDETRRNKTDLRLNVERCVLIVLLLLLLLLLLLGGGESTGLSL